MTSRYDAFAARILASGVISDPWLDGEPRFREEPLVLSRSDAAALARVAEDVARVYHEACLLVGETPELLDGFFGLTPAQKSMWLAAQPFWHGIARADLFLTPEGPVIAELNCDTPTGEAEAVVLGALARADHPSLSDPNEGLRDRFSSMLRWAHDEAVGRCDAPPTVGLVYPTELTEDLSLVRLYRGWLEGAGFRVVLGSPYNLTEGPNGLCLFDEPVSIVVRHYKTDWWGERTSAWDDETIPDGLALEGPLSAVLRASLRGQAVVMNPFGAVLPQNKRMMAFFWEHLFRFSPKAQSTIERHVPVTRRLEVVHEEQLYAQRTDWVLKSDYGAEGEEVIIGRDVTPELWRQSIAHARPGRWVAQRFFEARTSASGEETNLGVFLVGGEAAGIYARVSRGPTDGRALSVPVLVE